MGALIDIYVGDTKDKTITSTQDSILQKYRTIYSDTKLKFVLLWFLTFSVLVANPGKLLHTVQQ